LILNFIIAVISGFFVRYCETLKVKGYITTTKSKIARVTKIINRRIFISALILKFFVQRKFCFTIQLDFAINKKNNEVRK